MAADFFDGGFDEVAAAQVNGGRSCEADSGWGAGADDVAGFEGDGFADKGDGFGNSENHLGGVGFL